MRTILYLAIIIITILLIFSINFYRDLLSPGVVIHIPWLFSLVILSFSGFDFESDNVNFLFYIVGILCFCFGFFVIVQRRRNRLPIIENGPLNVNFLLIKITIIIEAIIIVVYGIYLFRFANNYFSYNLYFSLKMNSSIINPLFRVMMGYLNFFIFTFTALLVYLADRKSLQGHKILLLLQILLALISSFYSLGRSSILIYAIVVIGCHVLFSNLNNRKIISLFILISIVGSAFFTIYNGAKYPYIFETESFIPFMFQSITGYTSGGIVAFLKWLEGPRQLLYGENTFRFLFALLDALGYEVDVPLLTNSFTRLSEVSSTNVYTVHYFYARDFGLAYALLIQIALGMLNGVLYIKSRGRSPFWGFLFVLSLYPLVMQSFQDQYLSLTSTWIQFIFHSILIFRSGIFIKKSLDDR